MSKSLNWSRDASAILQLVIISFKTIRNQQNIARKSAKVFVVLWLRNKKYSYYQSKKSAKIDLFFQDFSHKFIFFRKIDFVLVFEEDKKDSIDNPGFMFDLENQEGAVNNGGAPTPSPTHHRQLFIQGGALIPSPTHHRQLFMQGEHSSSSNYRQLFIQDGARTPSPRKWKWGRGGKFFNRGEGIHKYS